MQPQKISEALSPNLRQTPASKPDEYLEYAGTADEEKEIGWQAVLKWRHELMLGNITHKYQLQQKLDFIDYKNDIDEKGLSKHKALLLRSKKADAETEQKLNAGKQNNYAAYADSEKNEALIAHKAIIAAREKKYIDKKAADYAAKLKTPYQYRTFKDSAEFEQYLIHEKSKEIYGIQMHENGTPKLFDSKGVLIKKITDKNAAEAHTKSAMVVNDTNKRIIHLMALYFSGNKEFEAHTDKDGKPYSLKKGILLFSAPGCGKSKLLQLFKENPRQSYIVRECFNAATDFKNFGEYGLNSYARLMPNSDLRNYYGQKELGIAFDDLGIEDCPVDHMGTKKNVMEFLMLKLYTKWAEMAGKIHLTTNLDRAQISQMYTPRVLDRFNQMFNFLAFPPEAKSFRE